MTQSLKSRGPDAQEVWYAGPVGFGHTMLRTTDQAASENQPCTLDGKSWITADARVDARQELIAKLRERGERPRQGATDPELILHAYSVWREALCDHLIGDFAFAIFDCASEELFCARDQMGVKPFYYAKTIEGVAFSNTLNCLRLHPAVTQELSEAAIGDFLLFGYNTDTSTTTFADIRQLPPASTLTVSRDQLKIRRYWQLPEPKEILYRDKRQYVDHFTHLLGAATSDRVRSDRVAMSLSGGLDSPAVAVCAKDALHARGIADGMNAITVVYDRIIPDREREFATLAAEKLGVPVRFIVGDDYKLFERWDNPDRQSPEPDGSPNRALVMDQFEIAAGFSRAYLDGYDADTLLYPSRGAYVRSLVRKRAFGRLLSETAWYLATRRRVPRLGLSLALKRRRKNTWEHPGYPAWLNPDFERRLNLRDRWEASWIVDVPDAFSARRDSYTRLTSTIWPAMLAGFDPGVTGYNTESRHPFIDTRIIDFCFSLPQVPWLGAKYIIRAAMRDRLPRSLLERPKEYLAGNVILPRLERDRSSFMETFGDMPPRLDTYVDKSLVPRRGSGSITADWTHFAPLTLGWWLKKSLR